MLGSGLAGAQLGEADAIEPGAGVQVHHVHAGNAAGLDHPPGALGALEAGQQQAARLVGQVVADQVLFLVARVVEVADQHLQALWPQYRVDRLEGLDEQQVGQRRHQHRHAVALRRGQRARRGVGHVAEFAGGVADLLRQFFGDAGDAAQRATR